MTKPFVYIFGAESSPRPEDDADTRLLKRWAMGGGKPDKPTSEALKRRLVDLENWRAFVVQNIHQASEALVQHQHSDGLDIPAGRTEEYQAGLSTGRFQGYSAANRLLVDIVNRTGLAEEMKK